MRVKKQKRKGLNQFGWTNLVKSRSIGQNVKIFAKPILVDMHVANAPMYGNWVLRFWLANRPKVGILDQGILLQYCGGEGGLVMRKYFQIIKSLVGSFPIQFVISSISVGTFFISAGMHNMLLLVLSYSCFYLKFLRGESNSTQKTILRIMNIKARIESEDPELVSNWLRNKPNGPLTALGIPKFFDWLYLNPS